MKNFIFIILVSLGFQFAQAQTSIEDVRKQIYESQSSCDQAVFTDENYLALSYPNYVVRVFSLLDKSLVLEVPTGHRVSDIKIQNDILYVLTGARLVAWEIKNKKPVFGYLTHPNVSDASDWRDKAAGFILKDNKAVIAHGVSGITVLDLANGKFLKVMPMPTISSAQDITFVDANTAALAIDNNDEGQFRGIYLMNLSTFEITKQIKIDNAFPSAVRVLDQNRLMMVYFNAVWKFDLDQVLTSKKEPKPNRRAWQFPGLFIVDMVGKVAFDQKNLYACFKTLDQKTDERKLVPLAIDLKTINLQ